MSFSPIASRSVRSGLLLGVVAAPLLAVLGVFGLGDAELTARAQLEREARVRARSLQSQWADRLGREAPIADTVDGAMVVLPAPERRPSLGTGQEMPAASSEEAEAASVARLYLLGARADLAAGAFARGMQQCRKAVAESRVVAGEALLLLVQIARLSGGSRDFVAKVHDEMAGLVPSLVDGSRGSLRPAACRCERRLARRLPSRGAAHGRHPAPARR